VIDGQNDRSHWRFQRGGEIWRCPICHAEGQGERIAVIEIFPFVELRNGKVRKPAKVLCCANCYLKHGRITEV